MNISRGIRRATLGPDSRDTKQDIGLLANRVQEAGGRDVGAVVGAFEETVCSEYISLRYMEGSRCSRCVARTRLLWRVPLCIEIVC